MKRLLIFAAGAAAVATLAACGGGSGGTSAAGSGTASGSTATVSARQIADAGTVLVNPSGQALYASDQESGGKVLCTGACLSFWKPLTIGTGTPTSSSLPGKLGVVTRPDGNRQVSYDGKLLYSFAEEQPGQVTGNGFADAFGGQQFTWHVVHTNGTVDSSGGGGGTSSSPYNY